MDKEAIIEETQNTYYAYIKIFMYIFAILYKSWKFRNINPSATRYKNPEVLLTVCLLHIIWQSWKILQKLTGTDIWKIWEFINEEKKLDIYIEKIRGENLPDPNIQKTIEEESERLYTALPVAHRLLYKIPDNNWLKPDELNGFDEMVNSNIPKINIIEAMKEIFNAKINLQYSATTVIINDWFINFINQSIILEDMRQDFYNSKLELHKYKENKNIVQKIENSIKLFDNDAYKMHYKWDIFLFILLNIWNNQNNILKKTFDFFFESEIYDDFFKANIPWGKE